MNNLNNNKIADNSLTKESTSSDNGAAKKSEPASNSGLPRIYLDTDSSEGKQDHTKLFVLPAGGMRVAYPDLKFHTNHFNPPTTSDIQNRDFVMIDETDNSDSPNSSRTESQGQKSTYKLPFGIEITAGPGTQKSKGDNGHKKAPPPSQTLLASAAFLKSYFVPTQDKSSADKLEASSNENEESVKNKFMGLWHNLKYGWSSNIKTNFSRETPIYMLGKVYHKDLKEVQRHEAGYVCSNIEGFKRDFANLGWFTYRRKFAPLPESALTTDCGWGCMIRSGQMMINTALMRHFLPASINTTTEETHLYWSIRQRIVKLFCDDPSPICPFSLHNLVKFGLKLNKKAGNWYGPSCVAHMFKSAVEESSKHIPALNRIGVHVAQDGAVYIQDVLDMCSADKCICEISTPKGTREKTATEKNTTATSYYTEAKEALEEIAESQASLSSSVAEWESELSEDCKAGWSDDFEHVHSVDTPLDYFVNRITTTCDTDNTSYVFADALTDRQRTPFVKTGATDTGISTCTLCHGWKSCIILIPVRLGGTSLNPIYNNCIYSLFLHDLCIGIIGGRPKHSLYFVGFQDESLIQLDPHFSQEAIPFNSENFPLKTYQCSSPRKISVGKIDPSATIGFYCHTRSQFYRLIEEAPLIANANDGNLDSPIFEFVDGRNQDVIGSLDDESYFTEDPQRMVVSNASNNSLPNSILDDIEELTFDP